MNDLANIIAQLDALEASLPDLRADHPEEDEFWMAFAGKDDVIQDNAGEHSAMVSKRTDDMLVKHGLASL